MNFISTMLVRISRKYIVPLFDLNIQEKGKRILNTTHKLQTNKNFFGKNKNKKQEKERRKEMS